MLIGGGQEGVNGESSRAGIRSRLLFSFLYVCAAAGFCSGDLFFRTAQGVQLLSSRLAGAAALGCLAVWAWRAIFHRSAAGWFNPGVLAAGLAAWLSSSYVYGQDVFFPGPAVRYQIAALGGAAVCAAALSGRRGWRAPFLWLCAVQAALSLLFLDYVDGRLIFNDDHPSFLYRLQLLQKYFPHVHFFNADWNAGYMSNEFYATGMMGVFYLVWPVLARLPDLSRIEHAHLYNYIFPYLFIWLVPWSVWVAGKVLGFSAGGRFWSALLALAPSLGFFEWLLKFGTLGFSLSAGLFPLVFALALRVAFWDQPPGWRHIFGLLAAASLCFQWTPMAVVFLPAAVCALASPRRTFGPGRGFKILCFCLMFALLNGPWILQFARTFNVRAFAAADVLPGAEAAKAEAETGALEEAVKLARGGIRHLRRLLVPVNPLLLLLAVPGLGVLTGERRRLAAATFIWALTLAAWGDSFKPQFEFRRMVVPAFFLAALLVGALLHSWLVSAAATLRAADRTVRRRAWAGVCIGVLAGVAAAVPLAAARAYTNRTGFRFGFAPPELEGLSRAISLHGGSGRTFFSGFILHELGAAAYDTQDGGHVAPLAALSGRELYASHYYHRYWNHVDPIPRAYLDRGEAGIEEFLDLVNATAVVSFKREWSRYFRGRRWYREVFQQGRFRLFVRERDAGGWVLKGRGSVSRVPLGIRIAAEEREVVVKYRYFPELRVRPGGAEAEIFPYFVFDEDRGAGARQPVHFIGVRFRGKGPIPGEGVEIGEW